MLCAIHQLHYLPWLRYFDKIARADTFIVLDNIQFNKNGWQNRNKVKTSAGATLLTVPVIAPLACDLHAVRIDDTQPWRKKHWATISQHYRKAPYFATHAPFLEEVYAREWQYLNALNRTMLDYFIGAIGLTTRVVYSSELPVPGIATERLVNLLQAVGARTYYSGAYALEQYLDIALLDAAGISLKLQDWTAPVYPQLHGEFVPELSVLDLLMNCGADSRRILTGG
ncbi:MAG TPA: WbqC family protein [Candidatus Hydrogenedentes bacterium]|nr:WbqC family protein [Candidatus Hydrogenedentota bacterium]HRK34015.1 WbqC family protein [Candidatus Hydrogenedentota bacterium]